MVNFATSSRKRNEINPSRTFHPSRQEPASVAPGVSAASAQVEQTNPIGEIPPALGDRSLRWFKRFGWRSQCQT
jgi:hypothetical protein